MKTDTLRKYGQFCLLLSVVLLLTHFVLGQNANTGEIKGTATDPSGAVISDVKVTITNVQTGVMTSVTTNSDGIYDVPAVPVGMYKVTFSKAGFRNLVRDGITLEIQTIAVDGALQVGSTSEQVVVTGEAPLVETETSDQHVNLSTEAIRSAPIVGTDWRAEMVQLIPGVNTGGGAGEANGQAVGINGTQSYNVMFLSDGGPATAPRDFNGSNYYMPVDAIGEVSVNSANAAPQYGSGLTSINVITRSGTNQWHGSGYEYIQNTAFNSRAFNNPTGPKSVEHWNTYGGSLGGPVIKNKLFFFFLFQRNPASTPTSGVYSYPTAAEEAGDFFGVTGATGPAFDPTTGTLLGTYDPVAQKLQSFFPSATARGWVAGCPGPVTVSAGTPQTCPLTNNFVFNGSSPNTDAWYTSKVDYNLSAAQRLAFSFNYFPTTSTYVPADPLFPSDATSTQKGKTDNLTAQLSHAYTISSSMLNEFRIGASRELDKYVPPSLGKNDPTLLGLEPTYGTNAPANVFPNVKIDQGADQGQTNLGSNVGGNGNIDAVLGEGIYTVSDVLTLIRGRHTIKVGGEFDKLYQNYTNWGDISSGNFEFNGSVTGIPYADFLAGDVYGWFVNESDPTSAHSWNSAVFASDDIKVTSHLTLNLGLRWQMQSGWNVSNNLFGTYDPNLPNSAVVAGVPVNHNGAILFGGQSDPAFGGKLGTIQNGNYKEFAPRIGVAWSPREKWVLRASYGIFDAPRDAENYTDGALGLGFDPHQVGPNGYVNGSAAFQLAAGPPAGTMVVFPTVQTLSSGINNLSGVEYYPRSMPTVYVQQLLLSAQHEFGGGILLDTSYVYTRGTNLNFQTDINQAPASGFLCTTTNCGNPNPIFNNIQAQIYDGYSNYNALQLRLQKRMSYGLNFQLNYAWSKSLDTGTGNGHGSGIDIYQNAYSPGANYGLSDFNATNTLVGQIAYELPFGHGRRFALNGPLDQIAGGWRVSSLFQWHGGVPFTPVIQGSVADGLDPGLTSSFNAGSQLYPDVVANPKVSNPTHQQWFNPTAFTNPTPGSFGNNGRNTLIGPGFANVNFSLAKEFAVREFVKLEIRADMFNVFNHINWANPDANVGYGSSPCAATGPNPGLNLADCTAGEITNTVGGTRIIQLGAHVSF
jgi:outer membrane receptor protein involved in Fe transport